ncbi:MAG: peptidyl-prolyl cis-trans isomerase [Acidobacteriia bacterium]|nr:peptidyl-prolyl cis-trans isomerase [Terriglobia bacterium]
MIRFLQSGNKAVKYFLGAILTVICLSMVVYLIPGLTSDSGIRQSGVVVTVAGDKIQADEIMRRVQQVVQQQRQQYPEFLRPYLVQQVIQQMVQKAEMRYEAERMGLTATDQEVQDLMRNEPYKSTFFPGGNWIGQQQYEALLSSNGLSVKEFEDDLRFDVLRDKLVAAVTAGVDVTPAEIERQYKNQNVKVKFDYAIVDGDEIQKKLTPTDSELRAWFETNKNKFPVPEKRSVNYFVITNQMAESKTTVSPDDVGGYYNANQERYRTPERIKTRHILVKTPPPGNDGKVDPKAVDAARAKAMDLLKQIKAGADFAELAKKNSDDTVSAQKGGDLDWVQRGQFVAEYDKAAFSMSKGQISDPVQSQFGFHIIQVQDKEEARLKPLSEVRSEIEAVLKGQAASKLMEQMSSSALKDAQKLGLDQAAAKYGAAPVRSNPVARTDALPGIGPAPDVMTAVFSVPEKAGFQMARGPQGVVVFEMEKIVPTRAATFEDVKDKVTSEFKAERSNTLLTTKTQELADRARAAKDLRKAAKELGLTVKTSELVGRDGQVTDIGSMNGPASAAFNLKQGDISSALTLGRKGAVLAVVGLQAPSMGEEFAKAKDGIRDQLIGPKRQQAMELFMVSLDARLENEHKVKRNKNELESLTKSRT